MFKTMTPGPTQIRENVRLEMAKEVTNADIDLDFFELYKETCDTFSKFFNTKNEFFLLCGEGILGLEAACASLTEKGDRALIIDNGIFGEGFKDFAQTYGAETVIYRADRRKALDVDELAAFLNKDDNFKYATLVHCDTPSGVLNDVGAICRLLKSHNITTVVDSVSAMFGEPVDVSDIDILCGGSQKALSAPVGFTLVCVSQNAFEIMEKRKTPIASYYCNLLSFKNYYKNKWFPYTMQPQGVAALKKAIDNVIADPDIYRRHKMIAEATRSALEEGGLSLTLESGFSSTVTAFNAPEAIAAEDILTLMREKFGVMLAGSYGEFAQKVIRIGHMGENANIPDMICALSALEEALSMLGFECKTSIRKNFIKKINNI